jgi:hypothetical protein
MPTPPATDAIRSTAEPVRLVRWIFQRAGEALTCQVSSSATQAGYDVCVVPHENVASAVIEGVDTATGALQRHAEIAMQLREAGWSLTHRTAGSAGHIEP